MEIKINIDLSPGIKKLTQAPGQVKIGMIRGGMINLAEEIEARAEKEAPVRTGNLLQKITSWVSADGTKATVASRAPYSKWVHEGTGLFGPLKRRIKPVTKKALFWVGAPHPFRSVAGQRPNPFFRRALGQIKEQDVFEAGVMNYLRKEGLV